MLLEIIHIVIFKRALRVTFLQNENQEAVTELRCQNLMRTCFVTCVEFTIGLFLISFWCAHFQLYNSNACFYKREVVCRKGWIRDFQLWTINRYHLSVSGNNSLSRQGSIELTRLMQLLLDGMQLPSSVFYFQMVNASYITCTLFTLILVTLIVL